MAARAALSRRQLLAGAAALAASPFAGSLAALGQSLEPDVLIIGAGAAGIAAARKVASAGRTYALIEATQRVGGRALTDVSFGAPLDLGARWLYRPRDNPLAIHARAQGLAIASVPATARLYEGKTEALDATYEDFVATVRRGLRAIAAAGDAGRDLPAARVIPDLGAWRASADFVLGPMTCSKDLAEVSSVDVSRREDFEERALVPGGVGALLESLAAPLAVRLETQARTIELEPRIPVVSTSKGTFRPKLIIICVPPSVIQAGKLRILPGLVPRYRGGIERITLGAYDRLAFEWRGNPLGLSPNETVHVKAAGERAFVLEGMIGGRDLYTMDVGGRFAQSLADGGEGAGAAFVKDQIAAHFGADEAAKVGRVVHMRWSREPFVLGGWSCALPGAGNLRRPLSELISARLLFAGEHVHETQWGTVGGAWITGEKAATQALAVLDGAPLPRPPIVPGRQPGMGTF